VAIILRFTKISILSQMRKIYLLFFFLFLSGLVSGQRYTFTTFDYDWCASQSEYDAGVGFVQGSFSIASNQECVFRKGQPNSTFIIELSPEFEFNTSSLNSSVSVQGNYLTLNCGGVYTDGAGCFRFLDANRIEIEYSTANVDDTDIISFNNFGIRPKAGESNVTGYLYRSGGTATLRNTVQPNQICPNPTSRYDELTPSTTEYFGVFNANLGSSYVESEVNQSNNLEEVKQYTTNNDILSIRINMDGNCGSFVQGFSFNTSGDQGTDLASNISVAKVYYTGDNAIFDVNHSETVFFGEFNNPNGNFTISGSQELVVDGNNYFWLTYDVPGDANTDDIIPLNRLDARLNHFVLDGDEVADMSSPNPSGHRPIVDAEFYYSLQDGTWNNNTTSWSTDSITACGCQPNGSGVVVIRHNITLDVARTVDVVEIRNGASLGNNGQNRALTVNSSVITYGSGFFNLSANPLTIGGDLQILGTGVCRNNRNGQNGDFSIIVNGGLTVNGQLRNDATGNNITADIIHNGTSLLGTGEVGLVAQGIIRLGGNSKTIPSNADLTLSDDVSVQGITIINNGEVTINGIMDGTNFFSSWVNNSNSRLNYFGTTMFQTAGMLNASSLGNTVAFFGTSSSIKGPNIFYNLHLDLTQLTLTTAEHQVYGRITIDNGTLITNGLLTLTSDANYTGSIGPLTSGSVSGNVTVERFISTTTSLSNSWRYLGSPVLGRTLQDWNDDLFTTGFPGADFSYPNTNIFHYDETISGGKDDRWVGATSITNAIPVGKGFTVYSGGQAIKVDVTGTVNSGTFDFGVSYSSHANPDEDGWNLVANPYPSPIDWDSPEWTKTNMSNAIYIWNPQAGQFATYINGSGVNGGSSQISSSQAFWVKASAPGPSLVITENAKSSGNPTFFKSNADSKQEVLITLEGSSYRDEMIIKQVEGASLDFMDGYDAIKLPGYVNNVFVSESS
jgi:hypothetical protein